jgi:DNA-binding NarL/FixJ family response regulator
MSSLRASPAAVARSPAPLGVLVVDDQRAVREGLARLISCGSLALRFVATAANAAEALDAAARLDPDVVVLDVDLDGDDGLCLIPSLLPRASILVLTSHGDAATRARAEQLGADAFLEKHMPAADLLAALERLGHLQRRGEKPPVSPCASSLPTLAATSAAPARRRP